MKAERIEWHKMIEEAATAAELTRRELEASGIAAEPREELHFYLGWVTGFRAAVEELDKIAAAVNQHPVVKVFDRHMHGYGLNPFSVLATAVRANPRGGN